MSKSLDPKKTARAQALIKEAIEPKFAAIVEEANKVLAKHGILIGMQAEWYIDKAEDSKDEDEDSDSTPQRS